MGDHSSEKGQTYAVTPKIKRSGAHAICNATIYIAPLLPGDELTLLQARLEARLRSVLGPQIETRLHKPQPKDETTVFLADNIHVNCRRPEKDHDQVTLHAVGRAAYLALQDRGKTIVSDQ